MCLDCHSQRDYSKFAAPLVPGTEGKGGELFGKDLGFPGDFYSPNITPAGVGNWTDGELFRTITTGVSKDGMLCFLLCRIQILASLIKKISIPLSRTSEP